LISLRRIVGYAAISNVGTRISSPSVICRVQHRDGDDVGDRGNVALVTGESALRQLVNHEELTADRLILKRTADRLNHRLSEGNTTLVSFEGLRDDCFLLESESAFL
jgi:hypothetical protein